MQSNEPWTSERLAAAAPSWTADVARGRDLLEEGVRKRQRSVVAWPPRWVAVTAALTLAVAAASHEVWQRMSITDVGIVRLDLSKLPLDTRVSMNGPMGPVRDLDEASRRLGFVPNFPAGRSPVEMSVVSPAMIEQTVHTAALRQALATHGASDVVIPEEWDGKVLRASLGATLIAEFADGVQLVQTKPIEMMLPQGFPLERFVEAVFRAGGMPWREARAFAQKFAMHPSWLLDIPKDEEVVVREIQMRSGPAVLIEDRNEGKKERFSILFGTGYRVYLISSPTEEAAVRFANSL